MYQLPSLTISDSSFAPPLPSATDPSVTVWADRHGSIGALSHQVNSEYWLHVVSVASFKLELETNTVIAVPREGADSEKINHEFQHTVCPTVLQIRGREVLHASAVSSTDGVVAFCALSETGKSTLAYALSQRGYHHWADDMVVLEVLRQSVWVHPLPFQLRLRPASATYFGYSDDEVVAGRMKRAVRQQDEVLPLKAVCLLEQVPALPEAVTIKPLSPALALPRLLEHSVYFSFQDVSRKGQMMQHYLNLITTIPILEVRFRSGLETLPCILDALEEELFSNHRTLHGQPSF